MPPFAKSDSPYIKRLLLPLDRQATMPWRKKDEGTAIFLGTAKATQLIDAAFHGQSSTPTLASELQLARRTQRTRSESEHTLRGILKSESETGSASDSSSSSPDPAPPEDFGVASFPSDLIHFGNFTCGTISSLFRHSNSSVKIGGTKMSHATSTTFLLTQLQNENMERFFLAFDSKLSCDDC